MEIPARHASNVRGDDRLDRAASAPSADRKDEKPQDETATIGTKLPKEIWARLDEIAKENGYPSSHQMRQDILTRFVEAYNAGQIETEEVEMRTSIRAIKLGRGE